MKKKLIFYFYITPDFFERKTNLINVRCLKEYAHIFDEAEFYLSLDNVEDYDLIHKIESLLIDLPFRGNISFKIHQNDSYRESRIVESEIINKIDEQDCLLFFAHGKGFTNLEQYEEESMCHWLIGCYYLSLNFIEEMESMIDSNNYTWISYGSFPLLSQDKFEDDFVPENDRYIGRIKHKWCFSGTFFWINTKRLSDHINTFNIKLPKIYDRYYSEKVLGNIMSYGGNAAGHNNMILYSNNNMYNDGVAKSALNFILQSEEERNEYNNFYNKIMNSL